MDKEIVERAKQGDMNAFALIFNEDYIKELYVVAKLKLNNDDDAKDAIQETVLETFRNLNKIKFVNKLKPWILKVLMNKCNNIFRHNHRFETIEGKDSTDLEIEDEFTNINNKVDLFDMLGSLEIDDRHMVFLYYRGYTSKEISSIMKVNENTVRTRIKRAFERIKRKYNRGDS
ncbi:MAG: RNA polymerase sigma factor [Clostridia bacterium]|nr:RNA polymerase sigma factor [Clostridia bacterium]